MTRTSLAPLLSATRRRDSCWITGLLRPWFGCGSRCSWFASLRPFQDFDDAPALQLGAGAGLHDPDAVAHVDVVGVVVRVHALGARLLVDAVAPGEEADALKSELIGKLTALRDGDAIPVGNVYATDALYKGPYLEAVQAALDSTIGHRAGLVRTGGSIPILGTFNRLIGVPMTGFGYGEGENIHSPNEYVVVDSFFQAIEAGIRLYHNLAETAK